MNRQEFQQLLADHLLPMLPGTTLGKNHSSTKNHNLVSFGSPCELFLKPFPGARFRTELLRSQAFNPEEKELVTHFIDEFSSVSSQADQDYFPDIMAVLPRRVISRLLSGSKGRQTLEKAIQIFEDLASQTYE